MTHAMSTVPQSRAKSCDTSVNVSAEVCKGEPKKIPRSRFAIFGGKVSFKTAVANDQSRASLYAQTPARSGCGDGHGANSLAISEMTCRSTSEVDDSRADKCNLTYFGQQKRASGPPAGTSPLRDGVLTKELRNMIDKNDHHPPLRQWQSRSFLPSPDSKGAAPTTVATTAAAAAAVTTTMGTEGIAVTTRMMTTTTTTTGLSRHERVDSKPNGTPTQHSNHNASNHVYMQRHQHQQQQYQKIAKRNDGSPHHRLAHSPDSNDDDRDCGQCPGSDATMPVELRCDVRDFGVDLRHHTPTGDSGVLSGSKGPNTSVFNSSGYSSSGSSGELHRSDANDVRRQHKIDVGRVEDSTSLSFVALTSRGSQHHQRGTANKCADNIQSGLNVLHNLERIVKSGGRAESNTIPRKPPRGRSVLDCDEYHASQAGDKTLDTSATMKLRRILSRSPGRANKDKVAEKSTAPSISGPILRTLNSSNVSLFDHLDSGRYVERRNRSEFDTGSAGDHDVKTSTSSVSPTSSLSGDNQQPGPTTLGPLSSSQSTPTLESKSTKSSGSPLDYGRLSSAVPTPPPPAEFQDSSRSNRCLTSPSKVREIVQSTCGGDKEANIYSIPTPSATRPYKTTIDTTTDAIQYRLDGPSRFDANRMACDSVDELYNVPRSKSTMTTATTEYEPIYDCPPPCMISNEGRQSRYYADPPSDSDRSSSVSLFQSHRRRPPHWQSRYPPTVNECDVQHEIDREGRAIRAGGTLLRNNLIGSSSSVPRHRPSQRRTAHHPNVQVRRQCSTSPERDTSPEYRRQTTFSHGQYDAMPPQRPPRSKSSPSKEAGQCRLPRIPTYRENRLHPRRSPNDRFSHFTEYDGDSSGYSRHEARFASPKLNSGDARLVAKRPTNIRTNPQYHGPGLTAAASASSLTLCRHNNAMHRLESRASLQFANSYRTDSEDVGTYSGSSDNAQRNRLSTGARQYHSTTNLRHSDVDSFNDANFGPKRRMDHSSAHSIRQLHQLNTSVDRYRTTQTASSAGSSGQWTRIRLRSSSHAATDASGTEMSEVEDSAASLAAKQRANQMMASSVRTIHRSPKRQAPPPPATKVQTMQIMGAMSSVDLSSSSGNKYQHEYPSGLSDGELVHHQGRHKTNRSRSGSRSRTGSSLADMEERLAGRRTRMKVGSHVAEVRGSVSQHPHHYGSCDHLPMAEGSRSSSFQRRKGIRLGRPLSSHVTLSPALDSSMPTLHGPAGNCGNQMLNGHQSSLCTRCHDELGSGSSGRGRPGHNDDDDVVAKAHDSPSDRHVFIHTPCVADIPPNMGGPPTKTANPPGILRNSTQSRRSESADGGSANVGHPPRRAQQPVTVVINSQAEQQKRHQASTKPLSRSISMLSSAPWSKARSVRTGHQPPLASKEIHYHNSGVYGPSTSSTTAGATGRPVQRTNTAISSRQYRPTNGQAGHGKANVVSAGQLQAMQDRAFAESRAVHSDLGGREPASVSRSISMPNCKREAEVNGGQMTSAGWWKRQTRHVV